MAGKPLTDRQIQRRLDILTEASDFVRQIIPKDGDDQFQIQRAAEQIDQTAALWVTDQLNHAQEIE